MVAAGLRRRGMGGMTGPVAAAAVVSVAAAAPVTDAVGNFILVAAVRTWG